VWGQLGPGFLSRTTRCCRTETEARTPPSPGKVQPRSCVSALRHLEAAEEETEEEEGEEETAEAEEEVAEEEEAGEEEAGGEDGETDGDEEEEGEDGARAGFVSDERGSARAPCRAPRGAGCGAPPFRGRPPQR